MTVTVELRAPHAAPAAEVARLLDVDPQRGLTDEEAGRRLREIGANVLEGRGRPSRVRLLLQQFESPLVWLLLAAAVVSGVVIGEWVDAAVIGAIVMLNAALGYVQESGAADALLALREMTAPRARVVRSGSDRDIAAAEVVPGDVLVLEAGSLVAADARLVQAEKLMVNEAVLTGESFPVDKHVEPVDPDAELADRGSMVSMGTAVAAGRGRAVVTATGARTAMGDIAVLVAEQREVATPLQRDLARLGVKLAVLALAAAAGVFALGVVRDQPAQQMFLLAVALAVAAIPEGLPAVTTITLARGVREMARRAAIVRRLPAVEALGGATVVCTDKTGTLTQNRLAVQRLVLGGRTLALTDTDVAGDPLVREYAELAALCNDARGSGDHAYGDPTEVALLESVEKLGFDPDEIRARQPRLAEAGFDSERKRMSTLHDAGDHLLLAVKGAPELLLDRTSAVAAAEGPVPLTGEVRGQVAATADDLAADGLRVLALASRRLPRDSNGAAPAAHEEDLLLVALAGMSDEIRPEVPAAVAEAQGAGVRVVLVTGDHRQTAEAVASQTGILRDGQTSVLGRDFRKVPTEQLREEVPRYAVYARVDPADKVGIVRAWRARSGVVAMTGDGVNDAPALRAADIGVAMGTGTDVAKDAADVVLTDDNFATIVRAIREGRRIFANLRKTVWFLLAGNLSEVLVIATAIAAFGDLSQPLLATQILWINLVTDGLPVLALGVLPADADVMERPPVRARAFLGRDQQVRLLAHAVVLAAATLAVLVYAHRVRDLPEDEVRTLVFTTLAFVQFLYAFNVAAGRASAWRAGLTRSRMLVWAILASATLQVAVVHLPPGQFLFDTVAPRLRDWMVVIGMSVAAFATVDIIRRVAGPLDTPSKGGP